MVTLIKYFSNQRYSVLGISVVMFLVFTVMRGNDERIGLGFISMNAIPSFLIIISGMSHRIYVNQPFVRICLIILAFTVVSFFLNSGTILPVYSVAGNIFLCLAVAQSFSMPLFKLIVDSAALILSFVFVSYYIGSYWEVFTDDELGLRRLSYLRINPNAVSEFITISVVSLIFIVYKARRAKHFHASWLLVLLVLLAVIPLLQTASRKGFFLFLLCLFVFFCLKFRWYEIRRLGNVMFLSATLAAVFFVFAPDVQFASADTLAHRFDQEKFSVEAGYRYDLAYKSIMKGLERPLLGHGLESSRDPVFLKSIGLWNEKVGMAINSHNGLINIFLKGGFVYLILHMLLFIIPMYQLYTLIKRIDTDSILRDKAILCFVYIIVFLGHVVSSGNGELYKLGWLLLGCSVGFIWHIQKEITRYSLINYRMTKPPTII